MPNNEGQWGCDTGRGRTIGFIQLVFTDCQPANKGSLVVDKTIPLGVGSNEAASEHPMSPSGVCVMMNVRGNGSQWLWGLVVKPASQTHCQLTASAHVMQTPTRLHSTTVYPS